MKGLILEVTWLKKLIILEVTFSKNLLKTIKMTRKCPFFEVTLEFVPLIA